MAYAPIMPAFLRQPKEAEIIGRILAGYGELEFLLAMCASKVVGSSLSQAVRMLFRIRGEQSRIEIADAMLRPKFEEVGLQADWQWTYDALLRCKDIRNQYSHCHFSDHDGGLLFSHPR